MTEQVVTWDEYAKHTNNLDCWVLVDGYLYDTTTYLAEHPGGDEILLDHSGFDATKRFNSVGHSEYAKSIRDARRVGKIQDSPMPQGHTQKVRMIKAEYRESKKKREEARLNKVKQSRQQSKGKVKFFSKAQISKHNKEEDCWMIYNNGVYDLSQFVNMHPGGPAYILDVAGQDGTQQYDKQGHSSSADSQRESMLIGHVQGTSVKTRSSPPYLKLLAITIVLACLFYYLGK